MPRIAQLARQLRIDEQDRGRTDETVHAVRGAPWKELRTETGLEKNMEHMVKQGGREPAVNEAMREVPRSRLATEVVHETRMIVVEEMPRAILRR